MYEELSQPELMDRLSESGIQLTTQTLRNWERNHLIIPPRREGGRGGKKSIYCEYVLAECYASHKLLQDKDFIEKGLLLPRINAETLSQARKDCEYYPVHFPCPPSDEHLYYVNRGETSLKVTITEDGIRKIPCDYNSAPKKENLPSFENHEAKLVYHYKEFLQLLWFRYVSAGCEEFLVKYKID